MRELDFFDLHCGSETQKADIPKDIGLLSTEAKNYLRFLVAVFFATFFAFFLVAMFFPFFCFFDRLLRRRTPCISHCAAHRNLKPSMR